MMTSSTEVILQVTSIDFGSVVKCDRKGSTNLDRVKLLSGSGSKKAFFSLNDQKTSSLLLLSTPLPNYRCGKHSPVTGFSVLSANCAYFR